MDELNIQTGSRRGRSSTFAADRPIEKLAEDELGRRPFAESMAKVIERWKGRDSLVIGIYGPWGCGKTSVKNMILDALASEDAKTAALEFNPWEWASQEKVFEGFFAEISSRLGRRDISNESDKIAKKFKMYAAKLSATAFIAGGIRTPLMIAVYLLALAGLIPSWTQNPTLVWWLRTIIVIVMIAASLLGWSGRAAKLYASYAAAKSEATRKTILESKNEISDLLREASKNLVVIIDDIDRLAPQTIRTIFQLVKANADFPNLIYVLLMQRDTVEAALGGEDKAEGCQFLGKIVQVGFDVPKLSDSKLDEYLERTISEIIQDPEIGRKFSTQRWAALFVPGIRPYFRNLRDVKRFRNTLSFHFELYKADGSFSANPVDVISLEVLRQFEPTLYNKLYPAKELLTGTLKYPLGIPKLPDQELQKSAELLVNAVSRPVEARAILEGIFPPVARALAKSNVKTIPSSAPYRAEWFKELRACHEEIFERYFRFALPSEDISDAELSSLIDATKDQHRLAQELTEMDTRGLLVSSIASLGANIDRVSPDDAVAFAIGLLNMEKQLFLTRASTGVSKVPTDIEAVTLIRSVLLRRGLETRGQLLREAISGTTALYLPMLTFESSEEERKSSINLLVTDEELTPTINLCVEKVRQAGEKGLLTNPWLRYILQFWAKWGPQGEASRWIASTITSDENLLSILHFFVEPRNVVSNGQVVNTEYRFALEDFRQYIDPEDLVPRVQQLATSESGTQYEARLFMRAFGRWKQTGWTPQPQNLDDWTQPKNL